MLKDTGFCHSDEGRIWVSDASYLSMLEIPTFRGHQGLKLLFKLHCSDKKYKQMAIQIGDKAPNFTLRDSDKNQVSLKDFKGKNVVILFFPLAFTSVCQKELCSMRDSLTDYNDMDAQILAISVDSIFVLDKWKKEEGFNFPLLSDFNKKVSKKYDTIYKDFVFEMKGVSKRSAFVVDKKGIVQYAEVLDNAGELPNFEAVKKALTA